MDLLGLKVTAVATDNAGQTASDESPFFAVVTRSARGYVTAATCQTCHADQWDDLFMSGHPYKLNKVENAMPPTYPFSEVPTTPEGFTWDDVSYVIGGYGWKARFMDLQGYILVTGLTGVPVQLNLVRDDLGPGLDTAWVDYHSADVDPKPYNCGKCHTTGWLDITENGGVNQDGLPGILGTWEETGIRCERCHGAGVNHVASQAASDINVDQGSELCGECHFRDTNHNILASGGFIRHHEQFDELISNGKQTFGCVDCHEPHIGVRYGNAAMGGIHTTCEDCHAGIQVAHLPIDCESCHMPRATKSARAVHSFEGDVRTHIFRVNPAELTKDDMFFTDPESGSTHTRPFVTLDFACYGCHNDPVSGEGGGGSPRSLADLSARASAIHPTN
jgi:hypothetical protein